jgi:hypothetical protein
MEPKACNSCPSKLIPREFILECYCGPKPNPDKLQQTLDSDVFMWNKDHHLMIVVISATSLK